ncbi:efflux RND transporter periplasmic adaptor subunit [uncultured Nevskia sp.]|uniref:efflux RND transporter periplasmic adaptor subunit n=1 Tax=uncultured Nevskia sp. TaxID=228950 RepID=UPI00260124A8|nr:efflux RND transporter periplasmic adaptor subunit [uncultured Nevskia sp.]
MNKSFPLKSAATLAALLIAACSGAKAPAPPAAPQVAVQKIAPRAIDVTADYVAQTEALNEVEIRPRVGGLLETQGVVEGSKVKKGQLLFVIDAQPYAAAVSQAKAALALAQAALDQSDRDLARVRPLSTIDAVSQQELDAAIARHDSARAQVEAAGASLQTAELNLGYTRVVSPIDGVIGRAQLKVGGLVTAYTTLLSTVYSTDPMYVNFAISEARVLEIQRELGGALSQTAKAERAFRVLLVDNSIYPHPGKMNFIDAAVDNTTGTLKVRLEVPNPDQLLRANQFARVRVTTQHLSDAIVVPQRALQEFQGKNFVWVIDGDKKASQRDIVLGPRVEQDVIIHDGLKAGDTVVVDGMQKLKQGITVAIKEPATADAPVSGAANGSGKEPSAAAGDKPAAAEAKPAAAS